MDIMDRVEDTLGTKGAKSRGKNAAEDTDILDTLGKEHDEVQELLEKLVDSESGPERTQLFKKIRAALVPHLKAEEKTVYQKILKLKDKDAQIDGYEGFDEHEAGTLMLKKLGKMRNKTSPEFSAAAKVLKELVNHHIKEEESNLWEHVRDNFSDDERIKMNRAFLAAKKTVKIPA